MIATKPAPPCPICRHPLVEWYKQPNQVRYRATCEYCGEFSITWEAQQYVEGESFTPRRHRLSGMIRNATQRGSVVEISSGDVDRLVDAAPVARTPLALLDDLLLLIAERATSFSEEIPLEGTVYPLLYLRGAQELVFLLQQLADLGRIAPPFGSYPIYYIRLTINGWRRVEELAERRIKSRQAFVAMWFDESVQAAWKEGIEPALIEAGYSAIRVDQIQHNDKIDDRIVAEIRRSGLLVADFTGHRGGVYFEAGLALGLGMPVIWTCREDQISDAHFDTRQYNHITWSNPKELHERLLARIRATVPNAKLQSEPA